MKNKINYKYQPKNKDELIDAIRKEIYEVQGTKDNPNWKADLNCIDTSRVEDMHYLFSLDYDTGFSRFNGDISKWDVSNVKYMTGMFNSCFNGDISEWDVSSVIDMSNMFEGSCFNGDISKWNVKNVKNMNSMFKGSSFNDDISEWDVSSVENMDEMFAYSFFNQDISGWNFCWCNDKSYRRAKLDNMFKNNPFYMFKNNPFIEISDDGRIIKKSFLFCEGEGE